MAARTISRDLQRSGADLAARGARRPDMVRCGAITAPQQSIYPP